MDSKRIEELAAQWLARRDSQNWSETEEADLKAWLTESTAHTVAFVRLEAAWKQTKRLKGLGAGAQLTPFKQPSSTRSTMHSAPRFALAASVLVAVLGSVFWYMWPAAPDYSTPIGGLASVPMSDGSKITLNTDSQVRVAVTESERRVELQHGEAFFEVAKDHSRPFVVSVGNKRVIAVGTAFSVRIVEGNDIRVSVTEGRVRIEDTFLQAGSIARTSDAGVLIQAKPIPDIQTDLSWRSGYLIFRDVALADAIDEFNRYNERKITIDDSAVANIRISGKFRSTQFEAFVRLLEEGFPVRAQTIDDRIVLTSR